jgi:hypothetical protein
MPPIDTSAHYKDALFWFGGPQAYGHPTKEDFEQAWGQTEGEAYAKALYARLERNGLIEPGPGKSIKLSATGAGRARAPAPRRPAAILLTTG